MKTFWDRFAFAYDIAEGLNKKVYRSMLSQIAALIPQQARVLECAAGTGAISIAVAPKAESVLCTDCPYPCLLRHGKKRKGDALTTLRSQSGISLISRMEMKALMWSLRQM